MSTPPTVFVIEPDTAVRASICSVAGEMDLRCETYSSGQEFLNAFDLQRPGCLVLEIRIPGVNGLHIQQTLADLGADLPLIFLTTSASVSIAVLAMRAGRCTFWKSRFTNTTFGSPCKRRFRSITSGGRQGPSVRTSWRDWTCSPRRR